MKHYESSKEEKTETGPPTVGADTRLSSLDDPRDTRPRWVPALTIAGHPQITRAGERALLSRDKTVEISRDKPLFGFPGLAGGSRGLESTRVSRNPFLIRPREDGGVVVERRGFSSALTVDGEPVPDQRSIDADRLEDGAVLVLGDQCVLVLHRLGSSDPSSSDHGMIGRSDGLEAVRTLVDRYGRTDKPVLILGESGTGKELVAQALHRASRRRSKQPVPVNVGAINTGVAEAAMFGSTSGAFTGATGGNGYFQEADGSTLFLDEIGEMSSALQSLLLRAIETGEVQKVGTSRLQKVDVRVISATDKDLEAAIGEGRFSRALLERLSVLSIRVPPLRRRRVDIGSLFVHFLRKELQAHGQAWRLDGPPDGKHAWIDAKLIVKLLSYHWPGNIRELKSVAEEIGLLNLDRDRVCSWPERLGLRPEPIRETEHSTSPVRSPNAVAKGDPSSLGREALKSALARHRYQISATASFLGIGRSSLHQLINRHGLPLAGNLTREQMLEAEDRQDGNVPKAAEFLKVGLKAYKSRRRVLGLSHTEKEITDAFEEVCPGGRIAESCLEMVTKHLRVVDVEHLRLRMSDLGIEITDVTEPETQADDPK